MTSRRFRYYGDSDKKAVKAALSHCLKKWGDGSLEEVGFVSTINDPSENLVNASKRWSVLSCGGQRIAYASSTGFARQLAFAAGWCDTELAIKSSKIWELTVDDCIQALAQSVLEYFNSTAGNSDAEALIPGRLIEADEAWPQRASGYLWCNLSLGRESLDLVIDPSSIEALLGSRSPSGEKDRLVSRNSAIAGRPCRIQVVAGSIEISIGELSQLTVGHIIQLDQRVDQPFDAINENGGLFAKAHLANCGAKKAAQLVKL